jgi:hypothetical protein
MSTPFPSSSAGRTPGKLSSYLRPAARSLVVDRNQVPFEAVLRVEAWRECPASNRDRSVGQAEVLCAHGTDIVVTDLAELSDRP